MASKELKYCIFCGIELKKSKAGAKIYCRECTEEPKKFSVSNETTVDEIEKKYKNAMVYCYICSEELERNAKKLWCPNCELIQIYNETQPLGKI